MFGGMVVNNWSGRDITCVISVYKNSLLEDFSKAINSILLQTETPYEILIVVDGPIGVDLSKYLLSLESDVFSIYYLSENKGPGFARDYGINKAKRPLIAIMDSDDYSIPERFKLQLDAFNNCDISVCGGFIEEFDEQGNIRIRQLPLDHKALVKLSKIRSPINNVTAMFLKKDYIISGGYPSFRIAEDYCLWLRFLSNGFKLHNIHDVLVRVKFDSDTLTRRKGLLLLKYDYFCQLENYKSGNINLVRFLTNLIILSIFRFLPNFILNIIYKTLLRK